ncbi:MAG: hypothetical protein ACTSWF_11945 [Candidatus Freyarchaeota archaeon]
MICWVITGEAEAVAVLLCLGALQPVLWFQRNRLPKRGPVWEETLRVLRLVVGAYFKEVRLRRGSTPGRIVAEVFRGIPNATSMSRAVERAHAPQVNLEKIFRRVKRPDTEKLTQSVNRMINETVLWAMKKGLLTERKGVTIAIDYLDIEVRGKKIRRECKEWIIRRKRKYLLRFMVASLAGKGEGRLVLAVLPVEPGKGKQPALLRKILRTVSKLVRVETVLIDSVFEEIDGLTLLGRGGRVYVVRMKHTLRFKKWLDKTYHTQEVTQILRDTHSLLDRLRTPKKSRKLTEIARAAASAATPLELTRCLGALNRLTNHPEAEKLCERMTTWIESCKPAKGRITLRGRSNRTLAATVATALIQGYRKKMLKALQGKDRKKLPEPKRKNALPKTLRRQQGENFNRWELFTGALTNKPPSRVNPAALLSLLSKERNQVETAIRDQYDMGFKTTSTNFNVRLFTLTLGMILHNLWLINNRIQLQGLQSRNQLHRLPHKERRKLEEGEQTWCVIVTVKADFKLCLYLEAKLKPPPKPPPEETKPRSKTGRKT